MKVAYYELMKSEIGKETKKAYGIITGYNGKVGINQDTNIYRYIAKSLIKEVENKLYIPVWLVSQDNLWAYVNKENEIKIEDGKKRIKRTKEQIIQDNILKDMKVNKDLNVNSYILNIFTGNNVISNVISKEIAERKINRLKEEGNDSLENIDRIAIFYINNNKIESYILNELDNTSKIIYDYMQTILK